MDNPSLFIVNAIQNFFIEPTRRNATSLIKVYNCKLSQIGDVSFPVKSAIWESYFKMSLTCARGSIFDLKWETETEGINSLLEEGSTWVFPVSQVKLIKDRCAIFLQRVKVTEYLFQRVLVTKDLGFYKKDPRKSIFITDCRSTDTELSEYRAKLVHQTLKNLIRMSDWNEVDGFGDASVKMLNVMSVVTRNWNRDANESGIVFKCGIVLDPQNGKLATTTDSEYIKIRTTDMRLMATHKYGIRIKDDQKFNELFDNLGRAAVTVDLLEVKPSSPVFMIRSGQGTTKGNDRTGELQDMSEVTDCGDLGASFILYNSARLETLLRTFNERVESGAYQPLPELESINLQLLNSEDEWELIYGYIFAFPNLIYRCLDSFETGSCGIHYLVKFLTGLASSFSAYYRRTRILTETRPHLMPYVYARIYLLKAIRRVFNMTLALLNIEPVQFIF